MVFLTKDQLSELLTSPKPGPKQHFIASCPYCGKGGHFYIRHTNTETRPGRDNFGLHDCKKCGEAGNLIQFLIQIGRKDLLGHTTNIAALVRYIHLDDEEVIEEEEELDLNTPERRWPRGFERVYKSKYLNRRKFEPKDYKTIPVGRANTNDRFKHYILIGITEEGRVKGFLGRCLLTGAAADELDLPRYRNSYDTNFGSLLYGYDQLTPDVTVAIIVEGLFDAQRINYELRKQGINHMRAVATFGKKISRVQIAKLLGKGIEQVVIFYDNDAVEENIKFSLLLMNYFKSVKLAYLPGKDDSADAELSVLMQSLFTYYTPLSMKLNCLKRYKL